MAILNIRMYPDPVLLEKSEPVTDFGNLHQKFFDDLIHTMVVEDGVGLAASQVGVLKRVLIVSPSGEEEDARVIVNPKILEASGLEMGKEGCLSFPGIQAQVPRAKKILLEYQDRFGDSRQETLIDFFARIVQHEMDHLEGILLIDRIDFDHRQKLLANYHSP